MSTIDFFVLVSGSFGVLTTFPLIYLALGAVRDARELRLIQEELAALMRETKDLGEEVRELQREIRRDQRAAKSEIEQTRRTVEQVSDAVEARVESVVEHVGAAVERKRRKTGLSSLLRRPGPTRAKGNDSQTPVLEGGSQPGSAEPPNHAVSKGP